MPLTPLASIDFPQQDPVSGLLVRESLTRAVAAEREAEAGTESLRAVVVLTLPGYRTLRKRQGQQACDRAVTLIGRIIATTLGSGELAGRYADDELVLWLPEALPARIEGMISHIHAAVEQLNQSEPQAEPLRLDIRRACGRAQRCEDLVALAKGSGVLSLAGTPQASSDMVTITASTQALIQHSFAQGVMADVVSAGATLLIVDDEPGVLAFSTDALEETGATLVTAPTRDRALTVLRDGRVDVLIVDINLQGASGLELLAEARRLDPTVVVIVITGSRELDLSIEAIRNGADDYVIKPFTAETLQQSVSRGLLKRRLILGGQAYQALLEAQVDLRSRQLKDVIRHLEQTYRETLQALGAALDTRDIETHAHSERVAGYALTLGRVLKMGDGALTTLERGVYLHDIGKIGIPDRILLNTQQLTPEEWDIMKTHCDLGYRLASQVEFLREASKIILSHHERFDGGGYPRGLIGDGIPFGARLFAVVDTLDAITSDRPYRKARSFSAAREEIARCTGKQFDPVIVEAFTSVPLSRWSEIRETVNAATRT